MFACPKHESARAEGARGRRGHPPRERRSLLGESVSRAPRAPPPEGAGCRGRLNGTRDARRFQRGRDEPETWREQRPREPVGTSANRTRDAPRAPVAVDGVRVGRVPPVHADAADGHDGAREHADAQRDQSGAFLSGGGAVRRAGCLRGRRVLRATGETTRRRQRNGAARRWKTSRGC